MEIYVVDKLNKIKMASIILSMKNAGHLNNPALKSFSADKLTIYSENKTGANIDGEPLYDNRFDIRIVPKAIRLDFDPEFIARIREIKYKRS